jgi:thioredoxin-dependent peroxiredoxin
MSNALLSEGQKAPDFELESDQGGKVKLSKERGHPVVVYFYPRDNTPGCTVQAIDFSKAMPRFAKLGAKVFGVSRDSLKSHSGFRDKHGLTITLLSDADLVAHKAYGAFGEKTMYGKKVEGTIRSTFVIDDKGVVTRVFRNVRVPGHVDAVLEALGGGAAPAKQAAATPAAKKQAASRSNTSTATPKPAPKAKAKPAVEKPTARKK